MLDPVLLSELVDELQPARLTAIAIVKTDLIERLIVNTVRSRHSRIMFISRKGATAQSFGVCLIIFAP
jgi:hypothetical protein